MYALQNYVGEQKLNTAIRAYLEKTRFSGPIYTNSLEFAEYLYSAVPDSLSYLFRDMFQEICLYENYVKELKYKKMPDNTYQVTLTVGSAKYYADNVGKLTAVPVNDYIDIGIFKKADDKGSSSERSVLLQRIRMDKPEKTFQFIVKEEPVSAGIDPYLLLIDRSPDNNKYKFSEKPSKPDL
jgi:ABC-2 type transport system permease protein